MNDKLFSGGEISIGLEYELVKEEFYAKYSSFLVRESSDKIAILDTETNWDDHVMTIGIAIADINDYSYIDGAYYILEPEVRVGGMYSDRIDIKREDSPIYSTYLANRRTCIANIMTFLYKYNVNSIFAYNALFDYKHLYELREYEWFDIMKIASNRNFNSFIPCYTDCYKTGKMKSGYGVEKMIRMVTGDSSYFETHNAIYDAIDELEIMRQLGLDIDVYYLQARLNVGN